MAYDGSEVDMPANPSRRVVLSLLLLAMAASVAEAKPRTWLVLNEISPVGVGGETAWIEVRNPTDAAIPLARLVLQAGPSLRYELPPEVPALRPGAYLLVRLDAAGPAQPPEHPSPGMLVVHAPAGLAGAWTPSRGELALYRPPSGHASEELADYVAWGAPGAMWSQTPERAALWPFSAFVPLAESFGVVTSEAALGPGASLGVHPGSLPGLVEGWTLYDFGDTTASTEVTPGQPNAVPRPKLFNLGDGAIVGTGTLGIAWPSRHGDDRYRFQLATEPEFHSPILDTEVETSVVWIGGPLPEGTYHYRVMALSNSVQSVSSPPRRVVTASTACDLRLPPPQNRHTLEDWLGGFNCGAGATCGSITTMELRFQRKDTPLVCLMCPRQAPCRWDRPQPHCGRVCFRRYGSFTCIPLCAAGLVSRYCSGGFAQTPGAAVSCDHGKNNCVRASIAMLASAYGSCLSQDRIAFQHSIHYPPNPDKELGHWKGVNCFPAGGGDCSKLLRWALGIGQMPAPGSYSYIPATPAPAGPTPDFTQVRGWIDTQQPMMAATNDHVRVLAGYCSDPDQGTSLQDWVYVLDPLTGPRVELFSGWSRMTIGTWVGPPVASWPAQNVQDDSASIWNDGDGDGLTDFDERRRFATCLLKADSDGDGIPDKQEDLACISRRSVLSSCPPLVDCTP